MKRNYEQLATKCTKCATSVYIQMMCFRGPRIPLVATNSLGEDRYSASDERCVGMRDVNRRAYFLHSEIGQARQNFPSIAIFSSHVGRSEGFDLRNACACFVWVADLRASALAQWDPSLNTPAQKPLVNQITDPE